MKIFIILAVIVCNLSWAGTKEYVVGSGSEFKFSGSKGENISLSIYITDSSFTKLGVEYFFTTGGLLATEAWQQFHMGLNSTGLSLEAGFIMSSEMSKPEMMNADFRNNNEGGVKVEDFFFSKLSDIEKYKVGTENIEVPAGNIISTHYQKKREEQVVDFWISDKAGAIGLVKLISKGSANPHQNYTLELMSLIKNVKAKINPKEAVPLSDKGRMFLGKSAKK
jgi:hypothetical protein